MIRDRDQMGELDLGELPRRWHMRDSLYEAYVAVNDAQENDVLHARMIDEAQVAGHRVYGRPTVAHPRVGQPRGATGCLASSRRYSVGAMELPRPTFEAPFHVLRLLEPELSLEPRQRGLRLEYLDEIEAQKCRAGLAGIREYVTPADVTAYEQELPRASAVQSEHERTYRGEAAELGMRWPPAGINVTHALGALAPNAATSGSALLLQTTWRTLSGMQHGRASTLLCVTNRSGETASRRGVTVK